MDHTEKNIDAQARQYTDPDARKLLVSLNEAWTVIRKLQRSNDLKDHEIERLKKRVRRYQVMNIALTSVITGLAWEGVKALAHFLAHVH